MIRNSQYRDMLIDLPTYYEPPPEPCLQWVLQFNFQTTYTMAYAGEGHIDWGNGDKEDLAKKTSFTNISKTYPAGTYTVKITGAIEDIQAGMDTNSKNAVVALEQFNLNSYIGNRATSSTLGVFYGCKNMVLMPGVVLGKNIKSLNSTFRDCSSLTTAPTIPDGVTGLNSTFRDCSSLTTAPTIPDGVTDLNGTFYGCTGLVNIDGIWPANGFTASIINIAYMFYRSTVVAGKPAGTIPADKLWERTDITWISAQAFRNCTSLSNYDDIPANWK